MKREENTALRLRHDRKIELSRSGGLPRTPAGFTVQALDGYGLRDILPARPTRAAFISGCCSSGRDFVPRFLQTVPRGSALALHSCFTSIRLHRGLSPPDCWACPAHPLGARHARPARRSGRACAWLRSRRAVARRRCPALRAVAFGWCRGEERPDKSTRALAARRRTRSCVLMCQTEERSRPSGGPLAARSY